MACIIKEGKYYQVYFYLNGKRIKRSTRTTSRKIAEDIRKKIENEIAIGSFRMESYSPRVAKTLDDFKAEAVEYSKTNKASSTVVRETRILNNFCNYFGDIPLSEVTPKKIESYKAYLQNEKNFMPNGINIELRHMSAAFTVAVKYGYIESNPFKQIKQVQKPKKKPKYLTGKQAKGLLEKVKNRSIYSYILIALNTGARVNEVCNLKWSDIDLDKRLIKLHGKGAKDRFVPVPKPLQEYLTENKNDGDYVVTGSRNPVQISHMFSKYADDFGLSDFTFHNLRDTYASWLVQNGINLKIIQELLGHESIQTTMVYAHLAPDNKFGAVKAIEKELTQKDEE